MRFALPIAALVALLALGAGAALWLSHEATPPLVPIGSAQEPPSQPEVDAAIPDARTESTPHATTLAEEGEVTLVAQPAGDAAVAGWLRVDGRPPGEEVELRLGRVRGEGEPTIAGRTLAARDGTFRFDGVADDWSGAIVLPEHYRLARPEEHGGDTHGFPASAGQLGLVIDVLRRPMLRGRVLSLDGTPVAKAYVQVELGRANGTSIWGTSAEEDGRFARVLPSGQLLRLAVSCRDDDGGSLEGNWDGDSMPVPDRWGDLDVGDLRLSASETAWVLVLGPDGTPFAGASVNEIATTGMRTVVSDAGGRARVQLATNVQGFEVQAEGFRLVQLPRPAPGEELVAHLLPTNALTVEVLDARGEPWPHGRLRLRSVRPPFEGGRFEPATRLGNESTGTAFEFGRDREGAYARFTTGERGRVVWPGLVEGLDFELALEDAVGTLIDRARVAGLAAGERRSVRLQLTREPWRASGRCVGVSGAPISGARVTVSSPGASSTHADADENGTFEGPPLLAERIRVRASAAGYADQSLDDVALPADLTLVLRRGRALRVAVRDASGAPFDVGQVQARAGETSWNGGAPTAGAFRFEAVADAGLELEHIWHGRKHALAVPDGVTELDWELPALGRLEIEVDACAIGEHESGHLLFEALDGRGVVEQALLSPGLAAAYRFTPWPGRYRLRRVVHTYDVDADGWRTPAGSREIGAGVEVEVTAGRIAQAEVRNAP